MERRQIKGSPIALECQTGRTLSPGRHYLFEGARRRDEG